MSHRFILLFAACLATSSSIAAGPALANASPQRATLLASQPATTQQLNSEGIQVAQAVRVEQPLLLKPGDTGAEVTELQELLQGLGYFDGEIDGDYGQATKTAVSDFQLQAGLPADGQIDQATWAQMQEAVQAAEASPPLAADAEAIDAQADTQAGAQANAQAGAQANAQTGANTAVESEVDEAAGRNWLRQLLIGIIVLVMVGAVFQGLYQYGVIRVPRRFRQSVQHKFRQIKERSPQPSHRVIETRSRSVAATTSEVSTSGTASNQVDLDESTAETGFMVTTRVSNIAKRDVVEGLVQDLHSSEPDRRRRAIWELGQKGHSEAINPLISLMMDSDSSQRCLILAAVSEIGIRTLKPMSRTLVIGMQDESADVRKNAIREMTRIYDLVGQVNQHLLRATDDEDDEVRKTAEWALGRLNQMRAASEPENLAATPNIPSSLEQLLSEHSSSTDQGQQRSAVSESSSVDSVWQD